MPSPSNTEINYFVSPTDLGDFLAEERQLLFQLILDIVRTDQNNEELALEIEDFRDTGYSLIFVRPQKLTSDEEINQISNEYEKLGIEIAKITDEIDSDENGLVYVFAKLASHSIAS